MKSIRPLQFIQVRRTPLEKLFNSLVDQYHYLGYCRPVGEHLKYIFFAGKNPIACLAFSSGPRHIKSRDQFIGWSPDVRMKNLSLIAYNTRFLILPWIRVKCLASHILSQMVRRLSEDWQKKYHHPIYYLETFVDKTLSFLQACIGQIFFIFFWGGWKTLGGELRYPASSVDLIICELLTPMPYGHNKA